MSLNLVSLNEASQEMRNRIESSSSFLGDIDAGGELLVFEGAILCRAEVNANMDGIAPEGIGELARTLPFMPLTHEHDNVAVGVFLKAERTTDDALSTSGVVWRERFNKVAQGIEAGNLQLSVEAWSERAMCGMCGGEFVSPSEYCDHLANHRAVRWHKGLHALGGGVTDNPAGTSTGFANANLVIAHKQQQVPQTLTASVTLPKEEEMSKETEVNTVAMEDHNKVVAEAAGLREEIVTLEARIAELESEAAAAKAAHEAELARQKVLAERLVKISPLMTPEEIEEIKDEISGMGEKSFAIFASRLAPKPVTTENEEALPTIKAHQPNISDGDKPLENGLPQFAWA